MDSNEIPLTEGDIVELRKIGSDGWWFVRHVVTGEEGWAPASYLESVKRRSSHSTLSMSSLGKVLIACVYLHCVSAHSPPAHHSTGHGKGFYLLAVFAVLKEFHLLVHPYMFVSITHVLSTLVIAGFLFYYICLKTNHSCIGLRGLVIGTLC